MRFKLLFLAVLLMAIVEIIGIASILPFMQIAANPEAIHENRWLTWGYEFWGFKSEREMLIAAGVLVLVLITLSNIFKAFTSWLQQKFAWDVSHQIGTRLLRVYLNKPYGYFLTHNSSELLTNLIVETGKVTTGVLIPLGELISQIVVSLLIFILLLLVNPLVALSTLTILGLAYGIVFLTRRRYLHRLGKKRVSANQYRFRSLKETLTGIKTFRVYGVQDFFYKRYEKVSEIHSTIQPRVHLVAILPRYMIEIFAFGGVVIVILVLIIRGQNLQDIIPLLTLYVLAGYRMLPALQKAFSAAIKIKHTFPAVDSIREDLQEPSPLQEDIPIPHPIPRFTQQLELDDVSFYYDEAQQAVISGLKVTIPKGKTVAFVGSTGSGKTTLVDMIVGLLIPQKGQLTVDGEPLTANNALTWQGQLAYVPQEVFLFDDSVTSNVAIGKHQEKVDQERLEKAAKIANVHDFIQNELPDGYNTVIGEHGVRLSGGQRQRLGLARALYRQPEVLILDEATSALDRITENNVINALKSVDENLTIIVIAHRLSTVRHADCIYLLEHGKIIAEGNYEDLFKKSDIFREMVELS